MVDSPYDVRLEVYIRDSRGGAINFQQSASIYAADFASLARIMSRFHELFMQLQQESNVPNERGQR